MLVLRTFPELVGRSVQNLVDIGLAVRGVKRGHRYKQSLLYREVQGSVGGHGQNRDLGIMGPKVMASFLDLFLEKFFISQQFKKLLVQLMTPGPRERHYKISNSMQPCLFSHSYPKPLIRNT